jgi:hypothetical protein
MAATGDMVSGYQRNIPGAEKHRRGQALNERGAAKRRAARRVPRHNISACSLERLHLAAHFCTAA